MTLTLLALFLLPLSLKMVLDPEGMRDIIEDWADSRGLQFIGTVVLFGLSMLILLTSGSGLEFKWESLITWIGVLIAVKGIACMFPQVAKLRERLLTESRIPIFGFIGLLMVLAFVYIDVQLI
ncbi:MAG: hypothetical protein WC897_02195 [Candidatus Gracilibacteria bacterium]